MSSFKRRVPKAPTPAVSSISASKNTANFDNPGTRHSLTPSPLTLSSIHTISTGIPSLDDILGGGLPLSCSLLVLAPDAHSAYGELVAKYFVAQGLAAKQKVCIVGGTKEWVKECMWVPNARGSISTVAPKDEEERDEDAGGKVKIAWRYENMKPFQTTVDGSSQTQNDEDSGYCSTFDLTVRMPKDLVDSAAASGGISFTDVHLGIQKTLAQIETVLQSTSSADAPLRICIPSLMGCDWGDVREADVLKFLLSLRELMQKYQDARACASVSLSPHLCTSRNVGWTQQLSWMTDACIELRAFGANPTLTSLFPGHHGLLNIHTLPAPHSLLPPSDKYSTLRAIHASGNGGAAFFSSAVSSSSTSASTLSNSSANLLGRSSASNSTTGGGENNLAFKCMRKRLVFETLHLDLEGGVGERRTTPATNASALEEGSHELSDHKHSAGERNQTPKEKTTADPILDVSLEGIDIKAVVEEAVDTKKKKPKKSVAFRSDRPELYDF